MVHAQVCIGNGLASPSVDTYVGTASLTSLITNFLAPTVAPSPGSPSLQPVVAPTRHPTVTFRPSLQPSVSSQPSVTYKPTSTAIYVDSASACNKSVDVLFDARLSGAQYVCTYVPAEGSLTTLDIAMNFSGAVTYEFAGDMFMIIYEQSISGGVQIGGYDYYLGTVSYAAPWPSSWQVMSDAV